jgi:hypothetical protein
MAAAQRFCLSCGAPLQQAPLGRPRSYCTERCRSRARRARKSPATLRPFLSGELPGAPQPSAEELEASLDELAGLPPGGPEERVAYCIREATVVAADFARVGRRAPPSLALRCEAIAEQIACAVREFLRP